MDKRPGARRVTCPECGNMATAIVPKNVEIVEDAEDAGGKAGVNCLECGERFQVYYRSTE